MAKKELSNRGNWQRESGPAGKSGRAEQNLIAVFTEYFKNSDYVIDAKPSDLKHIYDEKELSKETLEKIFNPTEETMKNARKRGWGITPDFCIRNKKTGKVLFGEIKRQDGWVENTKSTIGRGNAHERMCKLFTPGLTKKYREVSKITSKKILPFWVVLQGDITRDPKRNREIALWFDKYDKNYFMWRPDEDGKPLIEHFNNYLKKYLD